jgi:hypothetical protein
MCHRLLLVVIFALSCELAHGQVRLQWKFAAGEKYETSSNEKITQKLTIGEADIDVVFEQHRLRESRIGEPAGDGRTAIAERYTAWQAELTAAGTRSQFDMARPDERTESDVDHFLDPQRALAKTPRTVIVAGGRVTAVEGYDKLSDGFGELSQMQNGVLLSTAYYRDVISAQLDRIPAAEVRAGETWERTTRFCFYGNQSLELTRQYKYVGPVEEGGRKLEQIDIACTKAVYELGPGGKIRITADPTELTITSAAGRLLFDSERGRIARSEEKLQLGGDITLLIGDESNKVPSKVEFAIDADETLLP